MEYPVGLPMTDRWKETGSDSAERQAKENKPRERPRQ